MYQSHWGLQKSPFPCGNDPELFYAGACQREALARLRFLVENRRRLGLVLGQPGVGKSLLLEVLARECQTDGLAVAQTSLIGLTVREFLWRLATDLGIALGGNDDPVRLYSRLGDHVFENQLQGVATVLLIDDVDQAGPDLLTHLGRLLRMPITNHGWLTIVLAANRSQVPRLGSGLLDLVDLPVDLQPWDELDTTGYLQLALVQVGAERPLLDDQAIGEIYRRTEGIPRQINRLADATLRTAAKFGRDVVDLETVQSAHEAISLPTDI